MIQVDHNIYFSVGQFLGLISFVGQFLGLVRIPFSRDNIGTGILSKYRRGYERCVIWRVMLGQRGVILKFDYYWAFLWLNYIPIRRKISVLLLSLFPFETLLTQRYQVLILFYISIWIPWHLKCWDQFFEN